MAKHPFSNYCHFNSTIKKTETPRGMFSSLCIKYLPDTYICTHPHNLSHQSTTPHEWAEIIHSLLCYSTGGFIKL